ncbi:Transposase DDE domain-containing protein [Tenacibaculum sp. MAR_2009_124]|uniref:IS4 family transposase n=1 Tax=Tenacibaculum sp. MAR_2009_124 TaxID=1250059 RepID=UPI0008992893|nr:IS4 family transposase [Tenacibaculum sp. MAR_2009_124]SEB35513.1 Transposase DDE domain-containing protein [Tenacibaculum sp. MAR_2009_124]
MSVFKDHKISVKELLGIIPEALLSKLSSTTNVDYYTKVLHGKKMFYLLLYGIVENEKLSQRTLEDTFNDSLFKTLFNLDKSESIRRSSISERLSKIDSDYFAQIYQCIYSQFHDAYPMTSNNEKHQLVHVDSSMVSEAASKLLEGIDHKNGKKSVKYTITFDGLLPCEFKVFTEPKYSSEDMALPEVIMDHVKQHKNHKNIYVIDRGLQSTRTMKDFSGNDIYFIARAKENRKYVELESLLDKNQNSDLGELSLIKDSKVYLYTGKAINNKRGNIHYKQELVKTPLRLIVAKTKTEDHKEFCFISNQFDLSAKEITQAYRKRWDIEVFFRFIKQELNVSHLVSLNKNGIKVVLYMTLIVTMLIAIYKKANNIGYKTAKRRFKMELRNLAIAMIVVICDGNLDHFET